MSFIQLLDESTINQIAAGEVVERPSAVVKELVENSVDAGATAITVEIKEGGLSFIRITDNGAGIAKEDISLAFLRHATSKIKRAEDLLSVTSLGFRGEALSSIAAVSQVELITKTPSALNGYRYLIEGGIEKSLEEIGCPGGTTIIARNIFYNTPARRKFLKSAVTETGYISDLMERLMVSHPSVSFKFISNNQVKLQSSGNNNRKDILYHVYGRDVSKEIIPVEYRGEDLAITGFIGKPIITRGNRNFENYFINGRYIKSNIITKAIEEAYKPYVMQHKYPFTSLYFEINPTQIDVNVHPQKLEIRLKNSEEVYQMTFQTIRDALSAKEMIPKVVLTKPDEEKVSQVKLPEPFEVHRRKQMVEVNTLEQTLTRDSNPNIVKESSGNNPITVQENNEYNRSLTKENNENNTSVIKETSVYNPSIIKENNRNNDSLTKECSEFDSLAIKGDNSYNSSLMKENSPNSSSLINENNEYNSLVTNMPIASEQMTLFQKENSEEPFLSQKAFEGHRIIGQLFSTYWLIEYKKDLFIIDQHAAHEKVLYEKIMSSAQDKKYNSQMLLPPIVLSLTLREQEVLSQYEKTLNQLGYEFEHFGGNEYSVRAVPSDLFSISEKDLLIEFIDSLAEEVASNTSEAILERVASLSCKAAVKANYTLSTEEASALIKELLTLENPYHCPHGRPVIISMSQYELEKKFKRIV